MDISHLCASRLHKTQDKCANCAEPYRWEHVDGVLLTLCPTCRAASLREWEDRRMMQEEMFSHNPPHNP